MKITIYELLGMTKDGKRPNFRYKGNDYIYDEHYGVYRPSFLGIWKLYNILNDEVEIIKEPFTEEIKELDKKHFHKKQRQLANKINEIIRKLKEMEK